MKKNVDTQPFRQIFVFSQHQKNVAMKSIRINLSKSDEDLFGQSKWW